MFTWEYLFYLYYLIPNAQINQHHSVETKFNHFFRITIKCDELTKIKKTNEEMHSSLFMTDYELDLEMPDYIELLFSQMKSSSTDYRQVFAPWTIILAERCKFNRQYFQKELRLLSQKMKTVCNFPFFNLKQSVLIKLNSSSIADIVTGHTGGRSKISGDLTVSCARIIKSPNLVFTYESTNLIVQVLEKVQQPLTRLAITNHFEDDSESKTLNKYFKHKSASQLPKKFQVFSDGTLLNPIRSILSKYVSQDSRLNQLQSLTLDSLDFAQLLPHSTSLPNLKTLILNCDITNDQFHWILSLSSLKHLGIRPVTDFVSPKKRFGALPLLKHFQLFWSSQPQTSAHDYFVQWIVHESNLLKSVTTLTIEYDSVYARIKVLECCFKKGSPLINITKLCLRSLKISYDTNQLWSNLSQLKNLKHLFFEIVECHENFLWHFSTILFQVFSKTLRIFHLVLEQSSPPFLPNQLKYLISRMSLHMKELKSVQLLTSNATISSSIHPHLDVLQENQKLILVDRYITLNTFKSNIKYLNQHLLDFVSSVDFKPKCKKVK